jgi:hypothetical protein
VKTLLDEELKFSTSFGMAPASIRVRDAKYPVEAIEPSILDANSLMRVVLL